MSVAPSESPAIEPGSSLGGNRSSTFAGQSRDRLRSALWPLVTFGMIGHREHAGDVAAGRALIAISPGSFPTGAMLTTSRRAS
jgi:hypothetical protein